MQWHISSNLTDK